MEDLFAALGNFGNPEIWYLILAGCMVGYVVGVLPGISTTAALALLTPVGLFLDSDVAFYFYASVMGAGSAGGAATAILLRIPGEPANIMSTFDGYQMTRHGRGVEALTIAALASALGAYVGVLALIAVFPVAREVVLLFGPGEKFWLVTFGLVAVPFLAGSDWMKGLVSACLGVLLSFIGRSIVTGEDRFTFGTVYLADGLEVAVFLGIGIFALTEVIEMIRNPIGQAARNPDKIRLGQIWIGAIYVLRRPLAVIRGSLIGVTAGVIPGLAGVTAAFTSYATERALSKTPEKFGSGMPEGVLAPEASNNANQGGDLIPTLFLGIPGSLEMAMLLGILMLYGIQPGPQLISQRPDMVWAIVLGLLASNTIVSTLGLLASFPLARLTLLKPYYVSFFVFATCMIGAYLLRGNLWDLMLALSGGVFGYWFRRLGYQMLPLALGFVLAPLFEQSYYQSLQIGYLTYSVFLESPLSAALATLCLLAVLGGPRLQRRLARGVTQMAR